MKVVEGSYAIAHAVMCCAPDVISAYPITPQTHIVEHLSQLVADRELDSEFLTVDSEFSALSSLVGASAMGARCYSSTTSQGLALMFEVLYNASGMRLPLVMTVANRALGAPLSIWNDHQDSVAARDSGWIQLYAEDVQEAVDMTPQAFKIAEDPDILAPVMVCMDGFILTHVYEPVELLDRAAVAKYLPPYKPQAVLDPANPLTFGAFADPSKFTEFRYMQFQAHLRALKAVEEAARSFQEKFGRYYGTLVDTYRAQDAEILLVAMGSVVGTIKDCIDEMRDQGLKVGLVKVRCYRPFPVQALKDALKGARVIVVLEKDVTVGYQAALLTDLKACLYGSEISAPILGYAIGLGGRDVTIKDINTAVEKAVRVRDGAKEPDFEFLSLNEDLL